MKGTCLFFADRPAWKTELPALVKRAGGGAVVALRVHAYAPERLPPFGKPELKAMWKQAADLGLVMQIHFEPHYAAGFEPLIRAFPKTPVLIDNLGRPFQATPEEYARVLRWSRLPNVHMKLSGFPNPAEYPFRDVRPTLKQIITSFGPDRLVWGGTFGVGATADSYKAGRAAITAHLADLPAADQAKILGGTAARLFHFADRVNRAAGPHHACCCWRSPAGGGSPLPRRCPRRPIAAVWAIGDGDTLERDARDAPRHLAGVGRHGR